MAVVSTRRGWNGRCQSRSSKGMNTFTRLAQFKVGKITEIEGRHDQLITFGKDAGNLRLIFGMDIGVYAVAGCGGLSSTIQSSQL